MMGLSEMELNSKLIGRMNFKGTGNSVRQVKYMKYERILDSSLNTSGCWILSLF